MNELRCSVGSVLLPIQRGVSNQAKSATRFRNLSKLYKISGFQVRFHDFKMSKNLIFVSNFVKTLFSKYPVVSGLFANS